MDTPNSFKITTTSEIIESENGSERIISETSVEKIVKSNSKFSPMLKFFKYVNGEFSINKEELLLIPEAKKLIHTDKGGIIKGDNDGRLKLWATKQFGVAWWVTNVNSPGIQSGLEGVELAKDAMTSLEIKDWEYAKDNDYLAFLEVYQAMYEKAAYAVMLRQLLMSFKDSADIIKAVRDNTIKLLRSDNDLSAEDIRTLMSNQKELISLAGDIPKQIDKLKNLQELVNKEEREIEMGRGKLIITKSMNPE